MQHYLNLLRNNFIYISIYIVAGLIGLGILTSYNAKLKIDTLTENRAFYDTMYIHYNRQYMDIIRAWDVGVRGFALMKDTIYLRAYVTNQQRYNLSTAIIDSVIRLREYPFADRMRYAMKSIQEYGEYIYTMEQMVRQDSMERFKGLLLEDRGHDLWGLYYPTWQAVSDFETKRVREAEENLQLAFALNRGVQLSLLIVGIPLLLQIIRTLKIASENQKRLLQKLDETNRKELFDDGIRREDLDAQAIIYSVTQNMKQAEAFIRAIAEGHYDVQWQGMTTENAHLNTTNVVGELLQLKEKLARVSREEERRRWAAEGIAQFNELLRKYQHDLKELSVHVLSFLIRYTGSSQGGIFIEKRQADNQVVLEMSACYAYERIKAVQRLIYPGEGLIGQVYLEKEMLHMNKIPADYTAISAGLGMVKPQEIIIMPLKTNDIVEGVLELATLDTYDKETIAFLERTCEFLASAIITQKNAEQNRLLLEQLKLQTETMRVQEEELRQNMEELQATHEALHRKMSENQGSKLPCSTH